MRRGGVGALLASVRIASRSPLVRLLLRGLLKEVRCEESKSILYYALLRYGGHKVSCHVGIQFLLSLFDLAVKAGVALIRGDEEELKKVLGDPAIVRGIETVLKGIALYGVTTPQKLPAPFMVVWNFTNLCNLRCSHCYQYAGAPRPLELSLSEKLKVVEELDEAGVAALALSGGEPTFDPDYLAVVKGAARRGLYVATATNGWRFADIDELKKAVEAGLRYVEISVDSANPKKHDGFRGVEGSWLRAVKALENGVKLGINPVMATTVTKLNVNEVEDIIDLAESIGVRRVVFFNFIPTGRGRDIVSLDLDPDEREEFMKLIYKEMIRRKMEIYTTAPQYGRVVLQMSGGSEVAPTHYAVGKDPVIRALAEYIGGCGAGRIYAALQPDGEVTPCVFMPVAVGNLRAERFSEIWGEHPLLQRLKSKDGLKGFCGTCSYRYVCGGCRARAYAYFGDPLGPDIGCVNNRGYYEAVKASQEALVLRPARPTGGELVEPGVGLNEGTPGCTPRR